MGEESIFMWPTPEGRQTVLSHWATLSISDGGLAIKNTPKKLLQAEIGDLARFWCFLKDSVDGEKTKRKKKKKKE